MRNKFGPDELKKIDGGYKVVLLLYILAMAEARDEKVLVFSGCLKTLDFVSDVLQSDDWRSLVPGLPVPEGEKVGGWEQGIDFLRIEYVFPDLFCCAVKFLDFLHFSFLAVVR